MHAVSDAQCICQLCKWYMPALQNIRTPVKKKKTYFDTVRGQKKTTESQLGFLNDYSLFCQTLWGPKRQSIHVFVRKIFEFTFAPLRYFFYPFLICGVLKKGHFPTSEVKNDDNSKFFENNYPRCFVQGYI